MSYEIKKYPDGTQYVKVNKFVDELVFNINSYQDLWALNQIKDVYNHNHKEVGLYIPCLLDAQADKRFNPDESSGLKLVCEFINSMKFTYVKVFHPHNPEVVEALLDNVGIIDNSYFIKEVLSTIYCENKKIERDLGLFYHQKQELFDNVLLFSPDAGMYKPLMKLADKLQWQGEVYGASKSRKYEDGKSKLVQVIDRQDFEGKDILIIDDICVYGGTFVGLANMLKERNCGKLYLAVSHMTVENPNKDLFTLFDKVFTTKSKDIDYLISASGHDKVFGITPENLVIL
jgi:ribose-phosphate pyrophosphokinase